jgi:hypothetical protein
MTIRGGTLRFFSFIPKRRWKRWEEVVNREIKKIKLSPTGWRIKPLKTHERIMAMK